MLMKNLESPNYTKVNIHLCVVYFLFEKKKRKKDKNFFYTKVEFGAKKNLCKSSKKLWAIGMMRKDPKYITKKHQSMMACVWV